MNIEELTIDEAFRHLTQLAKRFQSWDRRTIVTAVLLELNMSPKRDGFNMLVHAVPMYLDRIQVMKGLYPKVAQIYGVSTDQVEHSIRTAVAQAWKDRNEQVWNAYFPPGVNGPERPSNGAFISRIAKLMELWEKSVYYTPDKT